MEASRYEEFMKTTHYEPYNLGGRLTEAMVAKARKELGETEEVRAKALTEMRKLVLNEPGLTCWTDDNFLLQYLRSRKFDVKKAFAVLKNTFKVKAAHRDMFDSFDLEALKRAFSQKSGFYMPYRDKDGCAVAVIRMRTWDVDVSNAAEALIALTMSGLWCLNEPATQVCGVRLIVDVEGASWRQIRSLIPTHAYLLARAFTNCLPFRMKSIHLFNESSIFRHLISVMKLFLSEKMKNRIHLHGGNLKHLHKIIPKAILTAKDFGGDNPNDAADWFNGEVAHFLEKYREFTTLGYKK